MNKDWRTWPPGVAITTGVVVGLLVGAVLDSVGLWLALGVAAGALVEGVNLRRRRSRD